MLCSDVPSQATPPSHRLVSPSAAHLFCVRSRTEGLDAQHSSPLCILRRRVGATLLPTFAQSNPPKNVEFKRLFMPCAVIWMHPSRTQPSRQARIIAELIRPLAAVSNHPNFKVLFRAPSRRLVPFTQMQYTRALVEVFSLNATPLTHASKDAALL